MLFSILTFDCMLRVLSLQRLRDGCLQPTMALPFMCRRRFLQVGEGECLGFGPANGFRVSHIKGSTK